MVRLNLHMSKCHIVGNHMHWLNFYLFCFETPMFISDKQMFNGDESWAFC